MLIEQMTREESLNFLAGKRPARLACSRDGQPYIIPIYLARELDRFYGFSTLGKKIEWMRLNPLVCVEADEMESLQKWCSVIAFGRFAELPREAQDERHRAHGLLWRDPKGWEPGYARTIVHGKERELEPVYFRIDVSEISGRRAHPGAHAADRS